MLYIAIDGIDGCGKTSTIKEVERLLKLVNQETIVVREPGDMEEGDTVRNQLRHILTNKKMSPTTQLLLFFADRHELLISDVFRQAEERQAIVISDRSIATSLAYQIYGNDLELFKFKALSSIIDSRRPDMLFYLDVDIDTAIERLKSSREGLDVIESQGKDFLAKASKGFNYGLFSDKLNIAKTITRLDSTVHSPTTIAVIVIFIMMQYLNDRIIDRCDKDMHQSYIDMFDKLDKAYDIGYGELNEKDIDKASDHFSNMENS